MRIDKKFGETTKYFKSTQNENMKYIFAYEGNRTEVQYFNGIIENRIKLNINPLIKLVPLLRSIPQDTVSHPNRVLRLVEEHLEKYRCAKVFIDKIVDFIYDSDESGISGYVTEAQILRKELELFFINDLNIKMDDEIVDRTDILNKIAEYIGDKFDISNQVDEKENYIDEQQILYNKEIDKVCIIIDRNIRNLKDKYNDFLKKCLDKNYHLVVSNPDFELWLLIHNKNIFSYDEVSLYTNDFIDIEGQPSGKRLLENILSKEFDGYKKEKIVFEKFLPFIHNAIDNEKVFCEDIYDLENKLGSNVGVLLNEIIGDIS